MTYPYAHRTRKTESECIPFKPLGESTGGISNQISGMDTVVTYTVNTLYGQYEVQICAWHGAQTMTDDIVLKIRPWVDHAQSIPGNALGMFELGSSAVVTALTLSATSVADGKVMQIIPALGSLALARQMGPYAHGFGIEVNIGTNATGTIDFEAIFQRNS